MNKYIYILLVIFTTIIITKMLYSDDSVTVTVSIDIPLIYEESSNCEGESIELETITTPL